MSDLYHDMTSSDSSEWFVSWQDIYWVDKWFVSWQDIYLVDSSSDLYHDMTSTDSS